MSEKTIEKGPGVFWLADTVIEALDRIRDDLNAKCGSALSRADVLSMIVGDALMRHEAEQRAGRADDGQ